MAVRAYAPSPRAAEPWMESHLELRSNGALLPATTRNVSVSAYPPNKPILFLLDREFEDGQLPGQRFFCRHSLLLDNRLHDGKVWRVKP